MSTPKVLTGSQAGLSSDKQIRIALRAILNNGGVAPMSMLYRAVEQHMDGKVIYYDKPTEPVAQEDWDALQ